MKKKFPKSKSSSFDGDFGRNKSESVKDKSSKKRLSIYDDYEDEIDMYSNREKFKSRK
jgi:hypothetical protein